MNYVPDQGDIITLSFDPSAGAEIIKRRLAFVISRQIFSEHTGLVIVAPITSTIRNSRLEVVLPTKMTVTGAVLVYQLKSLDFSAREAQLMERSPSVTIRQVLGIARALLS